MRPLYKYYSSPTAITHVLKGNTIKWSSPFEFNDPFDNQFQLQMEPITEELINQLIEEFEKPEIWNNFQIVSNTGEIIPGETIYRLSRGIQSQQEKRQSVLECIESFNLYFPEFCRFFESVMSSTVIFCLTETYDNQKMWAHYAQNHSGVVIKFMPADPNSPLPLAKQVRYVSEMPVLRYKDFIFPGLEVNKKVQELVDLYTLTKTGEWSEEREWRLVTLSRKFNKESMVLKFEPKEIQAIYLGCNINEINRKEILEIITANYPWAEVFQASKSKASFALDFEKTA